MFSPVFLGSVVGFILVVNESVLRFSLLSSCVFVSRCNLGRGFPLGFLCVFDVFFACLSGFSDVFHSCFSWSRCCSSLCRRRLCSLFGLSVRWGSCVLLWFVRRFRSFECLCPCWHSFDKAPARCEPWKC